MSMTQRVDRFQQRHPGAGFPIAVLYKFADDDGHFLAALITYYGFLALFPLLLLLSTALGLLLRGNVQLQQQVIDSALREFPIIGQQLGAPERLGGGIPGPGPGTLVGPYRGVRPRAGVPRGGSSAPWSPSTAGSSSDRRPSTR